MTELSCPHCQAPNEAGARFCESCGQALPADSGGPRVIEADGFAASAVGRDLQAEELARQAKRAAGALLAVAILQTIAAVIWPLMMPESKGIEVTSSEQVMTGALLGVIAVIFYGLWLWARKAPYPAAIVGLVILVSLWLIDAFIDPSSLAQGFLVKIIILLVLVRAVKAGAAYRTLQRESTLR